MRSLILLLVLVSALFAMANAEPSVTTRRISQEELLDRIEGGWAGQMIGNIQGLPYEFKFKEEPGPIPDFVPDLVECRSDDDTDIELMHLLAMDRLETPILPYPVIARTWVASIHQAVWIANERARNLMREGVLPPWTSHPALNEHSSYNLSGQFCAESYGLLAPGLPREAGRIGSHYTLVTIRGEPLQATAWTTALVSMAFFEHDVVALLEKAAQSVDPKSQHAEMLRDVDRWWRESPDDWRPVRKKIHQKYLVERGWNCNATITNGALVATALLYGKGDFQETLSLAFALGYDADCNAALCGTVLGVMQGANAMKAHKDWTLPERYINQTRDEFPKILTMNYITQTTLRVAEQVIVGAGGRRIESDGRVDFEIPVEAPSPLPSLNHFTATEHENAETANQKINDEAASALDGDDAVARPFAAIRLARQGGKPLEEHHARVVEILRATAAEDPVLTFYAQEALAFLEERNPKD